MSERTVFSEHLIKAKSAVDTAGTIGPARASRSREWTFVIVFGPGTTAGKVKIEASHDTAFGGTWALQGSEVDWATASTAHTVSITGSFLALRARISTAVVGGFLDVHVVAT